ncbi:hypothetical protein GOQ27_04215 [Clostridium sp. D2Q-11]|uniref:Uncharacterized protein n=1 Tax=Anaeromonas frigoriresistens TaxID=2683708 RepID=A0A942Z869_9FIRM|nr:hypothetical protein [Anaeromonas frigoriresistens]MBS4537654.1 hypothetical protein [Anaeromonas frigoriresistens]
MKKRYIYIILILVSIIILTIFKNDIFNLIHAEEDQIEELVIEDEIFGIVKMKDSSDITNVNKLIKKLTKDNSQDNTDFGGSINGYLKTTDGSKKDVVFSPNYLIIDDTTYIGESTNNIFNIISSKLYDSRNLKNITDKIYEISINAEDLSKNKLIRQRTQIEDFISNISKSNYVNEDIEFLRENNIEFPNYSILIKMKDNLKLNLQFFNKNYFKIYNDNDRSITFKISEDVWNALEKIFPNGIYDENDIQYLFRADNVYLMKEKEEMIELTPIKNQIVRMFLSNEPYNGNQNVAYMEYPIRIIFRYQDGDKIVTINENSIEYVGEVYEINDVGKKFIEVYNIN